MASQVYLLGWLILLVIQQISGNMFISWLETVVEYRYIGKCPSSIKLPDLRENPIKGLVDIENIRLLSVISIRAVLDMKNENLHYSLKLLG